MNKEREPQCLRCGDDIYRCPHDVRYCAPDLPVAPRDLTAQIVRTPDRVAGISVGGRVREFSDGIIGAVDRKLSEGQALEARTQEQAAKLEAFARSYGVGGTDA